MRLQLLEFEWSLVSVVCCRNRGVNLAAWAERNGVAWVSAYRWFRAGLLPVAALRVGRPILVDEPTARLACVVALRCLRGCRRRARERIWIGRWRG
jgi:hypothetical protein